MTLSNSVTVQPQPGFASMLSSAVPMFLRTNEWRTVAPRSTLPASYTSSGTSRPPAGAVGAGPPSPRVAPVLQVEHDAAAILVEHMPLVGGVDLPVLHHHRLDPGAHRLAAAHPAVDVLEVPAVLGEEVGPGVPVLSHRAGAPVGAEGLLQLRAVELRHDPSFTRRRGRSRPRGSAFRAGLSARRGPCSRERRRPALPTGTPCASRPRRSRRAGSARAARGGRRRP